MMEPDSSRDEEVIHEICPECRGAVQSCQNCERYFAFEHSLAIHQHEHTCEKIVSASDGKAVAPNLVHLCLDCLEVFPHAEGKEGILRYVSAAVNNSDRFAYTSVQNEKENKDHDGHDESQVQDMAKANSSTMLSSAQSTPTQVTDAIEDHPEKDTESHGLVPSGSVLADEEDKSGDVKENKTSNLASSTANTKLQAATQVIGVLKEKHKDLRKWLVHRKDASKEPGTLLVESFDCEEDSMDTKSKRYRGLMDSAMNSSERIAITQEAELDRLSEDCLSLRERLEKLASNNRSLVKQNISLRRQIRECKIQSTPDSPFGSSLNQLVKDVSLDISEEPENAEESAQPMEQFAYSLSLQPLPQPAKKSGFAKFKGKVGSILGHLTVGTHAAAKSPNN